MDDFANGSPIDATLISQFAYADGVVAAADAGDGVVSIDSGQLDAADTLSAASATIRVGEAAGTIAGQSVSVSSNASGDPRKDLIVATLNNGVEVHEGDPHTPYYSPVLDAGEQSLDRAAPPNAPALDGLAIEGIPLAVVVVPTGASSIGSERLVDRREFVGGRVDTSLLSGAITGNNPITSLLGGDLSITDKTLGVDVTDEIDGQTITPDKVGSSSDPTGSVNTDSVSVEGMQGPQLQDGTDIQNNRDMNTTYQNTTGYSILVRVQMECASGDYLSAYLSVASSATTVHTGKQNVDGLDAYPTGGTIIRTVSATVPPTQYYRLRTFGQANIGRWSEREWRA